MSKLSTYQPLSGESIYDVAAKLYINPSDGIQDLITLNPGIDINASSLFGETLIYTSGLKNDKKVIVSVTTKSNQLQTVIREKQSVYDLSIQAFGDISKISELLKTYRDLNASLPVGDFFTYTKQDDPQADFFAKRNLIVATDTNTIAEPVVDNIILMTGYDLLLMTGDKILLNG